MKNFVRSYWKVLVFFTLAGLVGGFCVGFYLLDSYPADVVQEILDQGFTPLLMAIITAAQAAGYGLVLGALGIILAKKAGLWRDALNLNNASLTATLVVSVIGGCALILLDIFFFGNYSAYIRDSYLVKPTAVFILGALLYGGVIEEVMLRLFLMSLIALILHAVFGRGKKEVSTPVIIWANIIAALLFAAGHLPSTAVMMGITPMILLRCFLLNGGIGLLLGRLYRKHGIASAMVAHAGCHVVSKAIWILFI